MDQINFDDDVKTMGLEQMRRERVLLASELKAIESQISDLAFNNYRTYADAGRATHDCSKTFGEMRDKTVDLSTQSDELTQAFQDFRAKAKILSAEQELNKKAMDKSNPIWELLTLPSRMDICIRAGYYDLAYSLTNYGMQLQQQTQLIKNPLIKKVADRLVEARSYLLEELFNKFAGPLDLAESIKVVNNVRKMPYLTANQLRISVLQHRDIYLDKQILDISGNADMIVQAIEIYRTCMYDTLVLYLAVFPENEIVRKDPSADPRWESWPVLPPSSILSQWAISNIKRLLELIQRADMKSTIDLSTVWSKLMTMASSFGRMGIDFRPLIASRLTQLVENRFKHNIYVATTKLTGSSRDIVMIGIDPASLPHFETAPDAPPVPAAELSLWDDLTVYANSVVDSLNSLRFILTPVVLSTVVLSLRDSIRSILSWLATSHATSANFSRAVRIVSICLAPFFEKCVAFFFPPGAVTKIFGSSLTKQQYLQFIEFDMHQLAASCDGSDKIEEIVLPLLQKRSLADIDLEKVLKGKQPEEAAKSTTFYLEPTPEETEEHVEPEHAESENKVEAKAEDVQEKPEAPNSKIIVPEIEPKEPYIDLDSKKHGKDEDVVTSSTQVSDFQPREDIDQNEVPQTQNPEDVILIPQVETTSASNIVEPEPKKELEEIQLDDDDNDGWGEGEPQNERKEVEEEGWGWGEGGEEDSENVPADEEKIQLEEVAPAKKGGKDD